VIKRLAEQERERGLIISSDREIMHHAERLGATVMSAEEFSFRLQSAFSGENSSEPEEEDVSWPGTKKKGPAHRAPKKLRRQNRRVKKI
jgi:hypothetical protein